MRTPRLALRTTYASWRVWLQGSGGFDLSKERGLWRDPRSSAIRQTTSFFESGNSRCEVSGNACAAHTPGHFGFRLECAVRATSALCGTPRVDFSCSEQFARTVPEFVRVGVAHLLLDVLEVSSDGFAADAQFLCKLTRTASRSNQ